MNNGLLDVVIEVQTPRELLELLREGVQFNIADIRYSGDGYVSHLISFPADKARKVQQLFQKLGFKLKAVNISEDRCHAVVTRSCIVCRAIVENGAFMVFGKLSEEGLMEFRFISDFKSYRSILYDLQRRGVPYKVKEITYHKPKGLLTDNQERILFIALKLGFFDYPRKISLEELASKLKISPPTLSEVIRRGLKRLLEHHFSTSQKP